jgi:uncharacterized protein (DUF1499 family)
MNDNDNPVIRYAPALPIAFAGVALLAALAGFGARWGLWHFGTGFSILRWAMYGAILVAVAALVLTLLTWRARSTGEPGAGRALAMAVATLIAAVAMLMVPLQYRSRGADAPPIHDITTDTENPPAFVAIAPLRADAPNPVAYPGRETAEQQRAAYPDIRPLVLPLPLAAAYERAVAAVEQLGWRTVAAEPGEGRIEAADRTFWFGFRDDVVIRLTPVDDGRTIVDVRSKSRVGRGDLGTNARRVRAFLALLE